MNLQERRSLSDEELGNLLAAVGNNEAKANTLLGMSRGEIYTAGQLQELFRKSQGRFVGWSISWGLPFTYCQFSLAPIGLVAREIADESGTFGYQITDFGRSIGLPMAALMLDFSRRYPEKSLSQLFGLTQSHSELSESDSGVEFKKRSPLLRFKIFWELATGSLPMRQIDLMNKIGEDDQAAVRAHLEHLSEDDLVIYKSVRRASSFARFQLTQLPPEHVEGYVRGYKTLTERIQQLFLDNPENSYEMTDIISSLDLGRQKQTTIYPAVSAILKSLREKKLVEVQEFSGEKMSEIDLSDQQKDLLLDLVSMLYGIQNIDSEVLERGRKLVNSFSERDIGLLMEKARKNSRYTSNIPTEESKAQILSILSLKPLTAKELSQELTRFYGKKISEVRIRNLLSSLNKEGRIDFVRENVSKVWRITNP